MQAIVINKKILDKTNCHRTAHIVNQLEFWFKKKSEGFWKFLEPCAHPLYKTKDSWVEEIGCSRKSFNKSFEKYGVRYKSRTEFFKETDRFKGKLYACYYDRYSNRMFFFRDDERADEFFGHKRKTPPPVPDAPPPPKEAATLEEGSFSNGTKCRSYKDHITTSDKISKDISETGNETVKKMIEIWVSNEGLQPVASRKLHAFLKKALSDKFGGSFKKWGDFCHRVASSKFLMGEKNGFRANLEWAIRFDSIQKILDGSWYGIGDRQPKYRYSEQESKQLRQEIIDIQGDDLTKSFKLTCFDMLKHKPGLYKSWFSNVQIDLKVEKSFDEDINIFEIKAPTKFMMDWLASNYSDLVEIALIRLGIRANIKFVVQSS